MKKRTISLTLVLLMLLSTVACNESTTETTADTDASAVTETEAATEPEETGEFADRKSMTYDIGSYDFGGESFTICYTSEQMEEPYFSTVDESTTLVNDAVYQRQLTIEEQFNVKIGTHDTGGNWDEVANAVKVATAAGTGEYDLALAHTFIGLTGLMSQGYLYDWNKVPVVDMTRPWWNHNIADTMTIGGKLFVNSNDFIYQRPMVIYFNKDMITDFSLESPYDLVHEGTWTWDKLREMGMAVASDLNGDGKWDENDRYGFSMTLGWQTISVIQSCGHRITSIGDDGMYTFANMESEKMFDIFEKFYDVLYNSDNMFYNVIWTVDQGAVNGDTPLFHNGQLLFCYSNTELLPRFREMEISFGLLPLPKYDEAQKEYYSMADTQMLIVPADVKNIEKTGVIAEALAWESYRNVVPAVYETMFANKYLRDEQSYEMFNITRSGLVYEPLWTYGEGSDLVYALPNMMSQKSTDLASYYNTRKKNTEAQLSRVVEAVLNLD